MPVDPNDILSCKTMARQCRLERHISGGQLGVLLMMARPAEGPPRQGCVRSHTAISSRPIRLLHIIPSAVMTLSPRALFGVQA